MDIRNLNAGLAALLGVVVIGCSATVPTPGGEQKSGHPDEVGGKKAELRKAPALAKNIKNTIGMDLVLIPNGKFTMGWPKADLRLGENDDRDEHEVEITKAFYLGKYEVTKGEFAAFVRATSWANAGTGATDRHPVENVNCEDALAFCKWLSQLEGQKYRLPTEAEWEYSCHAGSNKRFCFGDNEDHELDQYAWYHGTDPEHKTHAVGQKKPNAWGLYDMHGNVWEWCQDRYSADYYKKSPRQDPQGPAAGIERVMRGGSCFNEANYCSAIFRNSVPSRRDFAIGFRVVCMP
jgi:formylglycine-generating enzyme required for sulfatase activity